MIRQAHWLSICVFRDSIDWHYLCLESVWLQILLNVSALESIRRNALDCETSVSQSSNEVSVFSEWHLSSFRRFYWHRERKLIVKIIREVCLCFSTLQPFFDLSSWDKFQRSIITLASCSISPASLNSAIVGSFVSLASDTLLSCDSAMIGIFSSIASALIALLIAPTSA